MLANRGANFPLTLTLLLLFSHRAVTASRQARKPNLYNDNSLSLPAPETEDTPLQEVCDDSTHPLLLAIKSNSTSTATSLLSMGANANIKFCDGNTPLLFTIDQTQNYPLASTLLLYGANPNTPHSLTDKLPLQTALSTPLPTFLSLLDTGFIQYLLAHGANPNQHSGFSPETPLLTAIRRQSSQLILLLLSYGADPNDTELGSPWSPSPLYDVIKDPVLSQNEQVVLSLLQYGADAAWKNVDGTSLLQYVMMMEENNNNGGELDRQWLVDALIMYGAH